MIPGDIVRVYPHGSPELAATAKVLVISENQRAIAVVFEDKPPFATVSNSPMAIALHPEAGIVLFASRMELNGQPWGPWVEMAGGGHYEIEKIDQ